LSTSRRSGSDLRAAAVRYTATAMVCGGFSAIYECLSHGVHSDFMVFLFAVPLVMGTVPALVLALMGREPPAAARRLWACAVLTLSLGFCVEGALEIYGTTSELVMVYWVLAPALAMAAVVVGLGAVERGPQR